MNVYNSKTTKGHPCPSWQLPTNQLHNIRDLGVTLIHIGLLVEWRISPKVRLQCNSNSVIIREVVFICGS